MKETTGAKEQAAVNIKEQELLMTEQTQQVVALTGQCNEATEATEQALITSEVQDRRLKELMQQVVDLTCRLEAEALQDKNFDSVGEESITRTQSMQIGDLTAGEQQNQKITDDLLRSLEDSRVSSQVRRQVISTRSGGDAVGYGTRKCRSM